MVERENRGKDDGRKTSTRESSGDTKISAPESESSVIGAAITNFTTSSETCNRPNENSSSKVATANTILTGIDVIINIFVIFKKNKEQGSQRKDVRTLRTSVDELYNHTEDNYADYFDVEETRVNETEIDTTIILVPWMKIRNESEEPPTQKLMVRNLLDCIHLKIRRKKCLVPEDIDYWFC